MKNVRRRALWVVIGLWAGLMLLLSGTASAEATTPYPPPPVTVTSTAVTTTTQVPPTEPPAGGGGALPNTGAGFDIGMTVLIGGAIVLAGVVLTVIGARRLRRDH